MVDFYPVLADAVARLPHDNAQARRDLYTRARAIFAARSPEQGTRELALALEAAISKVEAEAEIRTKATAKSLESILQVLQSDAPRSGALPVAGRALIGTVAAPAAKAAPNLIDAGDPWPVDLAAELGGLPNSLGTMLVGIAYAVAAIAFTAVTFFRGAVWLSEGLIGYPAMFAMMTITLALFVVPPLLVFRKISNRPTVGLLLRIIYSASRRAP